MSEMNRMVDARGIPCPGPVIEAKKALKEMTDGTLEVLVDNGAAVENLTKLGAYLNCVVTSEQREEKTYVVRMKLTGKPHMGEGMNAAADGSSVTPAGTQGGVLSGTQADGLSGVSTMTEAEKDPAGSLKKGQIVALSSDHMGEGDDVLGRLLMKGFIYALTELDKLPETILLYNGGARLSVEGSESLEDLKLLESQGVEILTCGTCLNHYGLSEKLSVGSVTNMYAIAEKMTSAESVVKP